MVNSNKPVTSKTSKGKVSIYVEKGRIKVRLPRQYFGGEQQRVAFGMNADESNMAKAHRIAERMTLDLQDGCFDETLVKYGIFADLNLKGNAATSDDQLPPNPALSLLEVWDMYCEYIKPNLKGSTYHKQFESRFTNFLKSAIEATKSEDAIKIRTWLVENREVLAVKSLLSHLSKAYRFRIKQGQIKHDPFDDMASEIKVLGDKGKKQAEIEFGSDDEILNKSKAYTWSEVEIILNYIQTNNRISHWYNFVKFKFITGVRTGEAIAFKFGDIFWEREQIVIRRNYDVNTKTYYSTKASKGKNKKNIRFFPMPKNGELWNLLKSIYQGELNENVFKSVKGKNVINHYTFYNVWHGKKNPYRQGIIPALIEQGKLSKYLPPYNTRHSFITHQIFDLKRDPRIVNAWCEHSENVSESHYRDTKKIALEINPELPSDQQLEFNQLKEQLRRQQELINKLLQSKEE